MKRPYSVLVTGKKITWQTKSTWNKHTLNRIKKCMLENKLFHSRQQKLDFILTCYFVTYLFACQPPLYTEPLVDRYICKWMVFICCIFNTMSSGVSVIWRNLHKDCTRWSFKRAAKALTTTRGNLSFSISHLYEVVRMQRATMKNAFVCYKNCMTVCSQPGILSKFGFYGRNAIFSFYSYRDFVIFRCQRYNNNCIAMRMQLEFLCICSRFWHISYRK